MSYETTDSLKLSLHIEFGGESFFFGFFYKMAHEVLKKVFLFNFHKKALMQKSHFRRKENKVSRGSVSENGAKVFACMI